MKKHILRTLCMAFILLLCLPMVACDFEFGGFVGELLADKEPTGVVPEQWESDLVIDDILPDVLPDIEIETSWVDEFITEDIIIEMPTEDITYQDYDTTEYHTTEPPIVDPPIPEPVLHFSFDECDAWIGDQNVRRFFAPGQSASWDRYAAIDDYNVEYVRVWGWVAFQSEQIGQVGYRIDDGEPIYDDAFLIEAEQPIIDAALAMGAQSASRISVMIPVRDLSGEHLIEIVARDGHEFGYQASIALFALEKAVDPNAPVFNFWPADMMSSLVDQVGKYDIECVAMGGNGEYVTITTGTVGDPWVLLPMVNGKGYVASYIAIKYRTSSPITQGGVFVGSGAGPTGQGDEIRYQMINDGKWHVLILDLSEAPAVQNNVVNYLRWDMFTGGQNNVIDISYIAAFHSEQAALDYDASVADRYTD